MAKQKKQTKPGYGVIFRIGEVEHETLLSKFLNSKINADVPSGITREKYHACLVSLCDMKQKDIAKAAHVSHGSVRVWQSDELFTETLKGLTLEFFNNILIQHIEQKTDKVFKDKKAVLKDIEWPELADAGQYSEWLRACASIFLNNVLTHESRFEASPVDIATARVLSIYVLRHRLPEDFWEKWDTSRLATIRKFLLLRIATAQKIVSKTRPNKNERKELANLLNALSGYINLEVTKANDTGNA